MVKGEAGDALVAKLQAEAIALKAESEVVNWRPHEALCVACPAAPRDAGL